MTELEAKISCRFCQQRFELFEDLQAHWCQGLQERQPYAKWLAKADAKVQSFESVVDEGLTRKPIREIIEKE